MAMFFVFSSVKVLIFLFQLHCQIPYIAECFIDFFFIGAVAAYLEFYIPATMNHLCCNLQQFQAYRINKAFAHMPRQRKPPEPVEDAVCQGMELQAVCIYGLAPGTYCSKAKALLALTNKVFHPTAVAVIINDLPVAQFFHVGDDERIHMGHLVIRFLNLEHYPAGRTP